MSAAVSLLLVIAEREAEQIIADAAAVDRRRVDLDQLGMQITALQRQVGQRAEGRPWPGVIQDALHHRPEPAVLPSMGGSAPEAQQHWLSITAALLSDPEAELDLGDTGPPPPAA